MNAADDPVDPGLLEEYRQLKQEIFNAQAIRYTILGFTVAATGTILGLIAKELASPEATRTFAAVFVSFGLGLLIAAQLLTIHFSHWIIIAARYIREFIERRVPGIQWETRMLRLRKEEKGQILRASRPLGGYYCFLAVAVYIMAPLSGAETFRALAMPTALMMLSIGCSIDLIFHFSAGWRIEWRAAVQEDTERGPHTESEGSASESA